MSPTDLARLEVAKRAYQAAQPRAAEVQSGVRRARLFLSRPRPRRNWFSKGLVFVVLALGGLAYAKPHALGELAQDMLPRHDSSPSKGGAKREADAPKLVETTTAVETTKTTASTRTEHSTLEGEVGKVVAADVRAATDTKSPAKPAGVAVATRATRPAADPSAKAPLPAPVSEGAEPVSDWGRVGQALAEGDDASALAALQGLSESDDHRTRDKADLGRAQLFMAHGNADKACALARALTHRRAGARIERQAQVLLKSCTR